MSASNVVGDVEISTQSGDLQLTNVRGDIEVSNTSGDISLRSVTAKNVRAKTTSGDVVYDGPLAYDAENADEMRQYVASMKRLLDLPVRVVHGGHYPSCGQERMRGIIRDFLAAFDR